jgi:ankyrin repeat protein
MRGQAAAVKALLAMGADPFARTADGRTAFEWALHGSHVAAILLLGPALDAPPPRPLPGAATRFSPDGRILSTADGWARRPPVGYPRQVLRHLNRCEWEGRALPP